jgi:fructose-specific phosphotransferase system IIC component
MKFDSTITLRILPFTIVGGLAFAVMGAPLAALTAAGVGSYWFTTAAACFAVPGAIVGTIIGATNEIVGALRESRQSDHQS